VWLAWHTDRASTVKMMIGQTLRLTGVLASGIWLCVSSAAVSAETADLVNKPAAELADLNLVQLMQIEVPTVVTASKHEQKVTEAPSSVTIITADDIKKYGYRTLADILRSVRGFYVTYDHDYRYIGVRGFSRPGDFGGRVLLLVDGHRMNDAIYDNAAVMTDFILDVDLIERVEVVRGPGAVLYGDNAFFAIINVITRRTSDFHGPEVSGSAGSLDTYQGRASYGNVFSNGLEVVASATVHDSRGDQQLFFKEFDSPSTDNGLARGLDDDHFYSVFGRVAWNGLSLEGGYIGRAKQVPDALYGTVFDDPRFVNTDRRGYTELKYEREFADAWEVLARAYYDYYGYDATYPFDVAASGNPPDIAINRDHQLVDTVGGELQVRHTFFEKHRVTAGAEYRNDFDLLLQNFDVQPFTLYQDTHRTVWNYGLYLQDEFQVLHNLVLNAGVRFDDFSSFGSTVNPRAALIYDPWDSTTLKFIYGSAYRAPNAWERYYSSNVNAGNPNLHAETIRTYEGVWEQALGKNLRSTVTVFYNQTKDLISQTTDTNGVAMFDNLDSANALGTEFELEGRWANDIRGRVSYSFTQTRDEETGTSLNNSPRHLAKFNLIVPVVPEKVFAGLEAQYTSSRTTLAGATVGDFYVVNFTLFAHKFWKGWEASFSVYNLFDYKYRDPSPDYPDTIPQDGRTFRGKLTCRF